MKAFRVLPIVLALIVFHLPFANSSGWAAENNKDRTKSIDLLWRQVVTPYLNDDVFREPYAYDSSHALMLPMIYAFTGCYESRSWMRRDFHEAFSRFLESSSPYEFKNSQIKSQFYYFSTKYASLASECDESDKAVMRLARWVEESLYAHWTSTPIIHWTEKYRLKGVKGSLEWKLSNSAVTRSYYSAIVDEELFALAAGAELLSAYSKRSTAFAPFLYEITNKFYSTIRRYGRFLPDGGWLFQPGAWQDHPDFKYAHHQQLEPGLDPAVTEGISWDSSHSHRMPLLLKSLFDGLSATGNGPAALEISEVIDGFRLQFEMHVLVGAESDRDGLLINNYMDGGNGVYRYSYQTVGNNLGYGPYQLSGIMLEGWFALAGSSALKCEYEELKFPLSRELLDIYVGPNTSRVRHPLVQWPAYFTNGFAELHAQIAASI